MKTTYVPRLHQHEHNRLASHGLQVPLLSSGETHRGYFEVPKTAVTFKPHSNKLHSYSLLVRQKVKEWVAWKEKEGWFLQGKPTLLVPVAKPFAYGEEEDTDTVRVYVQARYYRKQPLYITLDDFLERRDQAARYGVDLEQAQHEYVPQSATELTVEGTTNPLEAAEQRRQTLGLKRELIIKDGLPVEASVVPMALSETETE